MDLFKEHTNVVFVPRLSCTLGYVTDLLRHLMFEDIVHLLKVMEDVCDLVIPLPPCVLCSENVFVSLIVCTHKIPCAHVCHSV